MDIELKKAAQQSLNSLAEAFGELSDSVIQQGEYFKSVCNDILNFSLAKVEFMPSTQKGLFVIFVEGTDEQERNLCCEQLRTILIRNKYTCQIAKNPPDSISALFTGWFDKQDHEINIYASLIADYICLKEIGLLSNQIIILCGNWPHTVTRLIEHWKLQRNVSFSDLGLDPYPYSWRFELPRIDKALLVLLYSGVESALLKSRRKIYLRITEQWINGREHESVMVIPSTELEPRQLAFTVFQRCFNLWNLDQVK